jgi:HD-like signal output (HDOD) protein
LKSFSVDRLQAHSLHTAQLAKRFCSGKQAEQAFTGALMHGVGQLVLAQCMPQPFGEVLEAAKRDGRPLEQLEQERLGLDHAQAGAFLLGTWGLPFRVVEAVAFHLAPGKVAEEGCIELAAVYVAQRFAAARGTGAPLPPDGELDLAFLRRAGVIDRLPQWRTIASGFGP